MAFNKIDEYKEGVYPEYNSGNNQFVNCKNVEAYRPIDLSGLKNSINNEFKLENTGLDDCKKELNTKIEQLEKTFGTDFISVDGKALDIVDSKENFKPYINSINELIEEQKNRCLNLVDLLVDKTNEVNNYLDMLKKNYESYKKEKKKLENLNSELNSLNAKYNRMSLDSESGLELSYLSTEISKVKCEITMVKQRVDLYKKNQISEPDGSWVLR